MRKQQQQQEQQQSPLHRKKNVPIDLHQGSTSFSFPRPISNAWQNPFVRASSTMPVDNKRIAGPEITQPVVLREEKRLRKPLVTSIMRFGII